MPSVLPELPSHSSIASQPFILSLSKDERVTQKDLARPNERMMTPGGITILTKA